MLPATLALEIFDRSSLIDLLCIHYSILLCIMKCWIGHGQRWHARSGTAHPIICKRVTCSPPSTWHFSNQARTRPLLHSSTLSQRIQCTYRNPLLPRAHHMDTNVLSERPHHHCNSHLSKDIRTRMSLCTRPDNHNRISTVNHHQCISPNMGISNMFLTFQPGG